MRKTDCSGVLDEVLDGRMKLDFILLVVRILSNTEPAVVLSEGGWDMMALKSILLLVRETSLDCKSNREILYHFVGPLSWKFQLSIVVGCWRTWDDRKVETKMESGNETKYYLHKVSPPNKNLRDH
jgi:hypothetical protein